MFNILLKSILKLKYLLPLESIINNREAMKLKEIINPLNRVMEARFSVRKYDPSVKISREEMTSILEDALTAPSSLNLQPWRFVVIDSEEGKKTIKPYMMFNQMQWETSSAIIVIMADLENFSKAEEIYSTAVDMKLISQETKEGVVDMINSFAPQFTGERLTNSVMLDCGLVAMQLMLSAKNYGYDTNPIGGYMQKEMTEALGMDTNRYLPVLLVSIGKADEEYHNSIRYSVSEITEWK